MIDNKRGWGILGIVACVFVGSIVDIDIAEAQEAKNFGIEEIVVTARRISESMQDVPLSIQAFTGDSLSDRGLTNIAEIGSYVSNMEFDSLSPISGSSNTPNIDLPWELERSIAQFVHHYNHERYHESLDNITPADMYFGRYQEVIDRRAMIKQTTLQQRRRENLAMTGCH